MPPVKSVQRDTYSQLLKRIQNEIDTAKRAIDYARVRAYWKVGQYIDEDILKQKKRAGYGEYLYLRLAGDLKMGTSTIRRAVRFHREHPIPSPATQLSWSHYTELLNISDKIRRRRLEQWAIKEGAPRDRLREKIAGTQKTQPIQQTRLAPKKGALNIYQLIAVPQILPTRGKIVIDCGFNVWKKVSRREIKASRLVKERDKMSFTYKAYVQKIIDGDTLWAVIDLNFGNYVFQKLRLRGIDAPELNTAAGKKAKAFVAKVLKGLDHIIIRSSKSDKYDRYLADIFYGKEEIFLNQKLLDEGLAAGYKE